jgi:hypothetical protein
MLRCDRDETVVFSLITIAKEPILMTGQHDQALAVRQILEEPPGKSRAILNLRAVGAGAHIIIDDVNIGGGEAKALGLGCKVLRVPFRAHGVADRLTDGALPHQDGADCIERELLQFRIGELTLLISALPHGALPSSPRTPADPHAAPARMNSTATLRVQTRAQRRSDPLITTVRRSPGRYG